MLSRCFEERALKVFPKTTAVASQTEESTLREVMAKLRARGLPDDRCEIWSLDRVAAG